MTARSPYQVDKSRLLTVVRLLHNVRRQKECLDYGETYRAERIGEQIELGAVRLAELMAEVHEDQTGERQ